MTGTLLTAQIEALPTCKAIILSAYGSGNLPISEGSGVLAALKRAVEREILVVVISQCESLALLSACTAEWTQARSLMCIPCTHKDERSWTLVRVLNLNVR